MGIGDDCSIRRDDQNGNCRRDTQWELATGRRGQKVEAAGIGRRDTQWELATYTALQGRNG